MVDETHERAETCRRIAESSHAETKIVIDMMSVIIQLCDQSPRDERLQHIKTQAQTAKLNAYNLLGQLGEIVGDGD